MCLSESAAGGEAAGWDVHLTALIVCVCVQSDTNDPSERLCSV